MIQEITIRKPIDGVFRWTATQPFGPSTPIRATAIGGEITEWVWNPGSEDENRADAALLAVLNAGNVLTEVILGHTRYGASPVQHTPLTTLPLSNPVTGTVQVLAEVGA